MNKQHARSKMKMIILTVLAIFVIAILMAGLLFRQAFPAAPRFKDLPVSGDSTVSTDSGLIRGAHQDGVYRYLGVPYAHANKRFMDAEPIKPWKGVFTANAYGPTSPQGSMLGMSAATDTKGTSNDCQNLNVWTPKVSKQNDLPVMVWLHGGGFSTGSANERSYDGANLSRSHNVVVVSVNHRLNVFGHLDLSSYGEEYRDSGNVGLTDIIMALQWIKANIGAFGGDPNNVTLFGQSGGGAKALALMTSPQAKGLFNKAIVESGATETMGVSFATQEQSQSLTKHLLDQLGIDTNHIGDLQNVSVDKLQEASTQALQETANEYHIPAPLGGGYQMEWGPVVDGDVLPSNPVTDDAFAEAGKNVTLLIGSNLNEWTGMSAPTTVPDGTDRQALAAALQEAYPDKRGLKASRVDTLIRLPMLKIMSHKADQHGASVYSYVFTHSSGVAGSYHGSEIPYVFDNVSGKLADHISQAWVSFAKTGRPSSDGLPQWKPYTRENGATMILDDHSKLVHHHDRELMRLLSPNYSY